jgi:Ras-related GTP-binding protein C/D
MVVRNLIPEHDPLENLLNILVQVCKMEKAYLFDKLCKVCVAADSVNSDDRHNELCSDMIDVFIDFSGIYGAESMYSMESPESIPFDPESFSAIKLSTGSDKSSPQTILYLREVAPALSLVCVIRQESFEGKMGLIDYNFRNFRNQIDQIISKRNS